MPASKGSKRSQATTFAFGDLRARVERLRKDVEGTVETLGKRAVEILPEGSRKQVDGVIGRINTVRGDVNKTVETLRGDIEKRFRVVRGTVDKRVDAIRKETESRRKKLVSSLEKEARRWTERLFKRLHLPVRSDIDALKRRLTALERRLEELEKAERERVEAA